jgi:serine/threonine protein kinase/WD40 repeat protein
VNSEESNPIDLLAEDFVARYRLGEHPALTEYVVRHPELADEIRSLFPALVMLEQARSQDHEGYVGEGSSATLGNSTAPKQLGEFRILREVGRGGMGIVYEAIQESLGRHVALKILPSQSLQNSKHLQRFQREVRAAAKLHHPNIVPVFGAGEIDGVHFYAMQFIQGLALDQVATEVKRLREEKTPKSDPGTARQVEPIGAADAERPQELANADFRVEPRSAECLASCLISGVFAKPEVVGSPSVLRQAVDRGATPETQSTLRDSGRRELCPTDGSISFNSLASTDSRISGTVQECGKAYWHSVARIGIQVAEALQYAADQGVLHRDIKPANLLLDLKGNVWVTDFGLAKSDDSDELTNPGDIVGTLRYLAPERLKGESDLSSDVYSLGATLCELLVLRPLFDGVKREQLLNVISEVDPVRPRLIDALIPADLETIVLKAISKDSLDRYATASAMAEDLRRFLEDRPVLARRIRPTERLWRWCRRNRAMAVMMSTLSLLAVMLVAGGLITNVIRSERDEAIYQRERAQNARRENELLLKRTQAAELESRAREHLARATAVQRSGKEGQRFASLHEIRMAASLLPNKQLQSELRDAAMAAMALSDLQPMLEFSTEINGPGCFNHAGTSFVQFRLTRTAQEIEDAEKTGDRSVYGDFSMHLRRASDWSKVQYSAGPSLPCTYALPEYSLDDRFLIVTYVLSGGSRMLVCRDAESLEVVHTASIRSTDFNSTIVHHPDGATIAYQDAQNHIVVWDLNAGQERSRFSVDMLITDLCFGPTGRELAVLPNDGRSIVFLDAVTGLEIRRFGEDHTKSPIKTSLAWSADGQLMAACRADGSIEVWNVPEGKLISVMSGHLGLITSVEFSPKGHLLRTCSWDGSSRIWNAAIGSELVVSERQLLGFTTDGRVTFTTGPGLTAGISNFVHEDFVQRLHDLASGNLQSTSKDDGIGWCSFSPDEQLLVVHGASFVDFWDVAARKKLHRLQFEQCRRVLFHPDGSCFLTISPEGLFRWPISRSASGENEALACGPPKKIELQGTEASDLTDMHWLPDAKKLAIVDAAAPRILIRDMTQPAADMESTVSLPSAIYKIASLAVSPDGKWLATGVHHQPSLQVWNLDTLKRTLIQPEPGNPTPSCTVGFTADSRWMVVSVARDLTDSGHLVYEAGSWRRHRFGRSDVSPGRPMLWSKSNQFAAMTTPNQVCIMDVESGAVLNRLQIPDARFNAPFAVIRNDSVLAIISGNRASDVILWDMAEMEKSLRELGLPSRFEDSNSQARSVEQRLTLTIDDGGLLEQTIQRKQVTDGLNRAMELAESGRAEEAVAAIQSLPDLALGHPLHLNNTAWAIVTHSNCTVEHAGLAARMAEQAVAMELKSSSSWNTLGVACFRNGQHTRAIEALEKSEALQPGVYFVDNGLFLAMSYWQLGDHVRARKWLADATRALDKQSSPPDAIQRFRREAEAMVTPE